jgi:trigger factor
MDLEARRYGYTAEFEIIPEVSLNSLEGRVVRRPVAEVTEPDVDATIERLREQRTRWPAVERPAAKGDRVRIDFDGRVEGEPFAGGQGEDAPVDLGAGRFIPGFEEQLEGAVAGETRAVEVTFPDDYQNTALAGKAAVFEVRVREVQEPVVPAVDGDFVREFGIEDGDLERFRADVRANLERELSQRMKAQLKERVMDVLLEANPIEIPAALVAQETEALRQRMLQNIGGAEIQIPDEVFADDARRRVALGLIAAEVVREQDLKPDPERVRAAVEEMASTYEEPQQVVDFYYADEQRLASIQSMVVEEMVVEHLLEQMAVEDEPMSFTELTQQKR